MTGILEFKHAIAGAASLAVATGGVLMASITSDALVPIVMGAGGLAGAFVYLWNAPRDAAARRQIDLMARDIEYADRRIGELEKELVDECEAHRQTRRRLAECYDTVTKAGIIIVTPDPDREPPRPPPRTPV